MTAIIMYKGFRDSLLLVCGDERFFFQKCKKCYGHTIPESSYLRVLERPFSIFLKGLRQGFSKSYCLSLPNVRLAFTVSQRVFAR
jgi:hypothetical protein